MSEEYWLELISQGETMHVDFKAAQAWEGEARASLAKDIVAMANVRDGGTLLIGVAEGPDGKPSVEGVTPEQAATYDQTKVCESVASWFLPAVSVTIERPTVSGKLLVAIRVAEFDASPIICFRDGPDRASTGAKPRKPFYAGSLLVRTLAAKSEPIRTAEDMRALIRLGVTKTSNQLLSDFRRVLEGETVDAATPPLERELAQWSAALEARRVQWKSALPGHGVITMAFLPTQLGTPLDHVAMRKLVPQSQARWQGWSMPIQCYEGGGATIQNRSASIEGVLDLTKYQELWQLHASGAFMFARLLYYVEQQGEHRLPFEELIVSVALGVLFAQRLYQDLVPDGQVELRFSLLDTKGQRLGTFEPGMRLLPENFRSGEDVIESRVKTTVLDLRSAWRAIVQRAIRELFALFNWEVAPAVVDQRLDEMEGRRRS